MKARTGQAPPRPDSRSIGLQQQRHQQDEFRAALRALLMQPLLGSGHPALPLVRRQAAALRDWLARETGWVLQVDRDGARLFKRPADPSDSTRGLPRYDRRRYTLLCLAAAVLERGEAQVSLRTLGERLLLMAAEPLLAARGFAFTLATVADRRDLVVVCQTLLGLGMLQRVAGDEEAWVQGAASSAAASADALYDVQRRPLAALLAGARGPSTWPADEAPATLAQRLRSLIAEHVPDSDEGRRTALRHRLARALLDDPVVYLDDLDEASRAYFSNQRGALAARLAEATGLQPEQRAEGLALTDEDGSLSDVAMPAEGTEAHATLLVAEHLASGMRGPGAPAQPAGTSLAAITAFLAGARERHGRYWRKSAREPGGERELAALAIERLLQLRLLQRVGEQLYPRAALARFSLGPTQLHAVRGAGPEGDLFAAA